MAASSKSPCSSQCLPPCFQRPAIRYSSNAVPERSGNRHVADSYVPFDMFEAADGWVTIVCATDEHWVNLCRALGRPELGTSESLGHLLGRVARIDEVTAIVAEWTATRTRQEICDVCDQHHVAAAPIRDVMEVLADPICTSVAS